MGEDYDSYTNDTESTGADLEAIAILRFFTPKNI